MRAVRRASQGAVLAVWLWQWLRGLGRRPLRRAARVEHAAAQPDGERRGGSEIRATRRQPGEGD